MMTQGIRRVVAVTGMEAELAMSKAEGLMVGVEAADRLSGAELEAQYATLKQVPAQLVGYIGRHCRAFQEPFLGCGSTNDSLRSVMSGPGICACMFYV